MKHTQPRYLAYLLTNTKTNKQYVGITKSSLRRRWVVHKCAAKRGDPWKLSNAIRKHGNDCWEMSELYYCFSLDDARIAERELIATYNTYQSGYNSTRGGEYHPPKMGHRHSEETKQKLRKIHSGKSYHRGKSGSDNPRFGHPGTMLGRTHSDATRKKMSDNHHRRCEIILDGKSYRSMSAAARELGWTVDKVKYRYLKSQSQAKDQTLDSLRD